MGVIGFLEFVQKTNSIVLFNQFKLILKNSLMIYEFRMKIISATDASRFFSSLLRVVAAGEVVTVLSRGKSVAVISAAHQEDAFKLRAYHRLVERLKSQLSNGDRNWTRDELYES
jgi:prevent-host-death family protein